jgi:glucose-6-phosphate dehydrogenase assembly protein OpcA
VSQAKTAAQQARAAAAEAAAETLSLIRPKTDPNLHETIERAITSSIEHLTASVVEEARKAYQTTADQLDAKIQQAVAEAVKNLPVKRPNRGKGKP